jgi:filamentous hemagglutinin family protein
LRIRYLARAASMTGFALITALSASAQNQGLVIRDGSLGAGPAGVRAGTDPTGGAASYLIKPDQGKQVGGNLFHSFSQFSIGKGETATFTGPDPVSGPQSVHAIISRVTGGNVSEIDGTLRSTIPGADVYLANPAGVVFGEGARLDVPAGFHATTADDLEFGNGEVFEARKDGAIPILAVAPPESFGFL